jgi:hypothetical protein
VVDSSQDAVFALDLRRDINAMATDAELEPLIQQVNDAHKALRQKIESLVRGAGGNRRIVYKTTLSDGGEVKLHDSVRHQFDGARVFQDRWKLSEYCAGLLRAEHGHIDRIAEIGVETGVYSAFLWDLFKPAAMMLLDLRFTLFNEAHLRPGMTRLEGYSSQTIPQLDNASLMYAYIDAAHDFKNVSADIENILPKMRRGGIVQFNDYATFNLRFALPYGVKAAVNNLINSGRVAVVGHGLCPLGFDDVAVRVL